MFLKSQISPNEKQVAQVTFQVYYPLRTHQILNPHPLTILEPPLPITFCLPNVC